MLRCFILCYFHVLALRLMRLSYNYFFNLFFGFLSFRRELSLILGFMALRWLSRNIYVGDSCLLFVIFLFQTLFAYTSSCIAWLLMICLNSLLLACLALYFSTLVFIKFLFCFLSTFFFSSQPRFFNSFSRSIQNWQVLSSILVSTCLATLWLQLIQTYWCNHKLSYFLKLIWLFTSGWYFLPLTCEKSPVLWFPYYICFLLTCLTPDQVLNNYVEKLQTRLGKIMKLCRSYDKKL